MAFIRSICISLIIIGFLCFVYTRSDDWANVAKFGIFVWVLVGIWRLLLRSAGLM